jgi:hypothetical protein
VASLDPRQGVQRHSDLIGKVSKATATFSSPLPK